jgi:hypothetical protein
MSKRAIIKKIIARLTDELEIYFRAAKFSRAEAAQEQIGLCFTAARKSWKFGS